MEKHDSKQSDAQQPLQLALTVDTAPVSQPDNSDGTYNVPAVSDVESHWREVNKLTKALRKRGRGSRRRKDKATAQAICGCPMRPMAKTGTTEKWGCRCVGIWWPRFGCSINKSCPSEKRPIPRTLSDRPKGSAR